LFTICNALSPDLRSNGYTTVSRGDKEVHFISCATCGACKVFLTIHVTRAKPIGDELIGKVTDLRYKAYVVQVKDEDEIYVAPTKIQYSNIRDRFIMWICANQKNQLPLSKALFGENGCGTILKGALGSKSDFDLRFG
jgi:hypothetical protein